MATPLVAGCAAVLREALIRNNKPRPRAALIEVLLVNGAVQLPDQQALSFESGFGRVNLVNSITLATMDIGATLTFREDTLEVSKDRFSETIILDPTSHVCKTNLVWSDLLGEVAMNRLLLNMRGSTRQERRGYDEKVDLDKLNNVQQVVWKNVPVRNVTIEVTIYDTSREPTQDFAVVWWQY